MTQCGTHRVYDVFCVVRGTKKTSTGKKSRYQPNEIDSLARKVGLLFEKYI